MKINHVVLLISSFVVFSISTAKSQEKCKYDINQKDPFTGKSILSIKTPINNMALLGFNWQLFLNKIGDEYKLETALVVPGTTNDYIEKGDSIMFKFDNGKIVTCYARERITPKPIPLEPGKFLTAYQAVVYAISNENFKTFTTSSVTYVQMNTGAKMYQKEMSEKNAKKLITSAVCIMQ